MRPLRALPLLLLAVAACSASGGDTPGAAQIVRPTTVEALSLPQSEQPLPVELTQDAALSVAHLASVGTLVGGTGGLFQLGSAGFAPVDAAPVRALATLEGKGIVVARDDGLFLWNGSLARSALFDGMPAVEVRALAARGEELWIGTTTELFLLSGGRLAAFSDVTGVSALSTFSGSSTVLAASAGGVVEIQPEGSGYRMQMLSDELSAGAMVPAASARVFALREGALVERVQLGADSAAWRPVALSLDEKDDGAREVEALAVDPVTGALWVVTLGTLARVDGGRVSTLVRPASLGPVRSIAVSADGALWISDGGKLYRAGAEGEPITYGANIQAFAAANCVRCHAPLKIAHPLDSYDAWSGEIDAIIAAVSQARMPQDGAPLVGGTAELLVQWKAQGLRR